MNLKKSFLLFTLAASLASQTIAQQTQALNHNTWGISAGWNRYTEPGSIELAGPELGLHGRMVMPNHLLFEGDVLLGKQHYSSTHTGSLNNVSNIESRWRLMTPVLSEHLQGISVGLGYHTLWNDLRGQTSTGHAGYQRIANQLWAPVRWDVTSSIQIEGGVLIYGRHRSNLSEANSQNSDITNTQTRGHYAQLRTKLSLDQGHTLTPFIRYTHLADSNTVYMGGQLWVEPQSHRWQTGVIWEFNDL